MSDFDLNDEPDRETSDKLIALIEESDVLKISDFLCDHPTIVNFRTRRSCIYYEDEFILETVFNLAKPEKLLLILDSILNYQVNINEGGANNRSILFQICGSNTLYSLHGMALINLVLNAGANVSHTDRSLFRPLHIACDSGIVPFVKKLIDHGADVNAQTELGLSPLHYAAWHADLETVRFMVDAGANTELLTNVGAIGSQPAFSPLDIARWGQNHKEVIDYLLHVKKNNKSLH